NDHDYAYRFWRLASKNPVSRFALRMIPQGTARRFVDNVERKLSRTNFKHKTNLPLQQMEAYARRRHEEGFTNIVFGHFHEKLVMPSGETTVTIVPAWYESGEAMVINPESGEFSFLEI
ncbi:MAG TPA: hypothetical protein VGA33_06625, partial [Thermoanaerobaculia bacterium]